MAVESNDVRDGEKKNFWIFMGRKKSNTTVKLRGKKYRYNRFFKLNDEEKI